MAASTTSRTPCRQVARWGGKIITIVPSTVGKVVPMGSPEDEWRGRSRASRSARPTREQVGVRIGARAAQPLRDLLHQPRRPGARAGRGRGRQLRRRLDIFHMNIEEADWARRSATPATGSSTSTWPTTTACRPARARSTGRRSMQDPGRGRLRRLPDGRVRRHRRPQPHLRAHRDRRRLRERRGQGMEQFLRDHGTGTCRRTTTTSTCRTRSTGCARRSAPRRPRGSRPFERVPPAPGSR